MVYIRTDKPFVYGDFVIGPRRTAAGAPTLGGAPFAIQILREYSANEFIGRLYVRGSGGTWVPASSPSLMGYKWYQFYKRAPRHLLFEMEGSGRWSVQHFREESDETGPYLAVALKYENPA